ncbi:MAG: cell division protein FtsZ [Bacteroidales bacterium]|nr:cell division protein FtsZ [Bacteroidales bacterium]
MDETSIDISSGFVDNSSQLTSIIRVIGVGGAGSNAVNNMYEIGIEGVNYVICNTDSQALADSHVPVKVQLGKKLTEGLGAGNRPERGRESALEAIDEIKEVLVGCKMAFVTAGMGGGTGTGAAPVIAKTAKEMGVLTIGIVSIPFLDEGIPRINKAVEGLLEMEKCVDSLLVINSQRILEMYGDLDIDEAMMKADNILALAAKGLAEIISVHARYNVDFADLQYAMTNSGVAVIGLGSAEGPNRALDAVKMALSSPLLNNSDIRGAKHLIVNVMSGTSNKLKMSEKGKITNFLREISGYSNQEELIWGAGFDETLGESIRVTVVATGFATDVILKNSNIEPQIPSINIYPDSTVDSPSDEESRVIDLTPQEPGKYDNEIEQLYSNRPASPFEEEEYSTKNLADPISISLEELRSEEVISNIENIPAYERRAIKN